MVENLKPLKIEHLCNFKMGRGKFNIFNLMDAFDVSGKI